MPRFSIVIPTCDRAAMLRHSLQTALEQTFDDFEVVVSNNASKDDTADLLASLSDGRVRCVSTRQRLSMVDHWEFALGHARGDWVLILCDDDALLPGCLTHIDSAIRRAPGHDVVQYDRFRYVYGDGVCDDGSYIDVGTRVRIGLRVMDSRRRLATVFSRLSIEMPKLLNCAVNRTLIDRVRQENGQVFGNWAPDIWVGVQLLARTRRYLKTGPLMLWGQTMASYGSGAARDPDRLLTFFQEFPEFDGLLPLTPYPDVLTVTNGICDTLWRAQQTLGSDHDHLVVDPVRYRANMLHDLDQYISHGHERFGQVRERVQNDLRRCRLRQRLDPLGGWRRMAARAGSLPEKWRKLTAGRKTTLVKHRHRFDNIRDAARFVGKLAAP